MFQWVLFNKEEGAYWCVLLTYCDHFVIRKYTIFVGGNLRYDVQDTLSVYPRYCNQRQF